MCTWYALGPGVLAPVAKKRDQYSTICLAWIFTFEAGKMCISVGWTYPDKTWRCFTSERRPDKNTRSGKGHALYSALHINIPCNPCLFYISYRSNGRGWIAHIIVFHRVSLQGQTADWALVRAIASQCTYGDLTGSGKGSGLVDISKMRRWKSGEELHCRGSTE